MTAIASSVMQLRIRLTLEWDRSGPLTIPNGRAGWILQDILPNYLWGRVLYSIAGSSDSRRIVSNMLEGSISVGCPRRRIICLMMRHSVLTFSLVLNARNRTAIFIKG